MLKDAFDFFEKNINQKLPILVGLSGGPDSTCLLHLLLLWNKVAIHLVHVDHGWREESHREAELIEKKAKHLNLPLHTTRLNPSIYKGNVEEQSRHDRYSFFSKVAKECNAQAILLGHHAGDLSETVFKRVLEGASLTSLAGIHKIRFIDGLCVMRPLLTYRKNEIIYWLEGQKIEYFQDPTNLEARFLRGRLRTEIFPYLREAFGKEFEQSLAAVGEEAEELYYYLAAKCAPHLEKGVVGPWGVYYEKLPEALVEMRYCIRNQSVMLSRQQIKLAEILLKNCDANKKLESASGSLFIDRGRAFFVDESIIDVKGSRKLDEGCFSFGNWSVDVARLDQPLKPKNSFIDVWKGEITTYLPIEGYTLCLASPKMTRYLNDKRTKEYGRFLNEKKIPRFLVSKVPVLCKKSLIIEDFLTGEPSLLTKGPCLQVRLVKSVTERFAKREN